MTDALVPYLRPFNVKHVWEPAAGDGQIAEALARHGFNVIATDTAEDGRDFLKCDPVTDHGAIAIVPTHPTVRPSSS